MSHDSVTIYLPSPAARKVAPAAALDVRLATAAGGGEFPPAQRAALLFVLAHDPHQQVRDTALRTLHDLPELDLLEIVAGDIHPCLLDAVARLHHARLDLMELIALNPQTDAATLEYLAGRGISAARSRLEGASGANASPVPEEDEEPVDEESDEFLSKYQLAQQMSIAEKIKTGLTGDKEWRGLLIKDSNKLVSSAVIKNPRITEAEVLTICKGVVQNDDVIRLICANKEWGKNYQIRKALVTNSKTPLAKAIRYLNTLSEKDVASLAKSKNVSSVISTQARRLIAQKQDKR